MAGNRFAPDLRNRKLRNRRPSHATVVAYLALFVALSGTAGDHLRLRRSTSRLRRPRRRRDRRLHLARRHDVQDRGV